MSSEDDAIAGLVDRFLDAIEAGDRTTLEAIYADDVAVWHNFTNVAQDKATNIARLERARTLATIRYDIVERIVIGDRLIQRHIVRFSLADGTQSELFAALFVTVSGGRIVRIDEYLDPTQSVLLPPAREAGR